MQDAAECSNAVDLFRRGFVDSRVVLSSEEDRPVSGQGLLAIWFIAGPLMSIILVRPLNSFTIGGVPFGFWMAHQGSIYVFVALIFANAWLADRQDREFDVDER